MKYWEVIADKLSAARAPFALLVFVVAAIAFLCSTARAAPLVTYESPCECQDNHGKHRWAEKNDPEQPPEDASAIQAVTPSDVFSWQGPTEYLVPSSARIWSEQKWYALTGRMVDLRAEEDGDLHIALQDATGDKPGIVVVEIPVKPLWCELRKIVFGWTQIPVSVSRSLGEETKAHSPADYHGDREGVLRHRPHSRRSLKPENRSPRIRSMGNSSGDENGSDSMKYWEIIADRLHAQGWSYGIAAHLTQYGLLFCVDAHRDGKRFIVKADDLLTAFLSLERDAIAPKEANGNATPQNSGNFHRFIIDSATSAAVLRRNWVCGGVPYTKRRSSPMKIPRIVLAVLLALAASANTLRAVPSLPTFSFHENGQGQLELPLLFGGGVIPLPGTLMSDPGPGGLSSALAFTVHPQVNPFPVGDVLLLDPRRGPSDILRFDPATRSSSGLTQLIFFYSNDDGNPGRGGQLADTGLPSRSYHNTVIIEESRSDPTIYTPTAGQPGFSTDSPLGDSFHIFSTPDTGSTLLMLGAAIAGLVFFRWKILAGVTSAR